MEWSRKPTKPHARLRAKWQRLDPQDRETILWLSFGGIALLAILLTGCGACQVAYGYDGARYYRTEDCGHGPVVTCDSATRLPNAECGEGDPPAVKE